ncbi:DNA-binding FadR family transcriptional regulator [Humitalea rosea]|uniref:DNA-binding FadR family transcriptional regulator n=2 Tax=Humitalea rosea TaxID=990373 RepID=A0A2W7IH11_9PROT|nr:DNA-binding FadR family transcriptional regulator [Humitalea rosea]
MFDTFADLRAGLSKRTVRAQITDKLAGMIVTGLLRAGDEMPSERDLAEALEVSRETVRGAIQALVARGMIGVAQGARSRVLGQEGWLAAKPALAVSRYSAAEIHGARLQLEVAAASEAARHIGTEALQHLHVLVEAQGRALRDPAIFHICGAEFHTGIHRASGNRLLAAILVEIYGQAQQLRRPVLEAPGATRRSWQDHQRILAAIAQRDPEAADAAMTEHLSRIRTQRRGKRAAPPVG